MESPFRILAAAEPVNCTLDDSDPECSSSGLVIVGILIALIASVGINIGNNIQALAMKRQQRIKAQQLSLKAQESGDAYPNSHDVTHCSVEDFSPDDSPPASVTNGSHLEGSIPPSPPGEPSWWDAVWGVPKAPPPSPPPSPAPSPPLRNSSKVSPAPPPASEPPASREALRLATSMRRARKLYGFGTALFFASTFSVFGAMAFAPASILAPIEAVQFPTNIAFAKVVNKVKLTWSMIISSWAIVAGVALAVGSGNHKNKTIGPAELLDYWKDPRWIAYISGLVFFAALAEGIWHVYNMRSKAGTPLWASSTVLPSLYALSSSMMGSLTVVKAKCLSELLESAGRGISVFDQPVTWVTIAIFVVAVVFWLARLNAALAKYDAIFIIPAIQAGYISWATLSAGMYFHDFDSLSTLQLALFIIGFAVMLLSLGVLARSAAELERRTKAAEGVAAVAVGSPKVKQTV